MSFAESQRRSVDRMRKELRGAKHCLDELVRITLHGSTDGDDHQASEQLSKELCTSNRPFFVRNRHKLIWVLVRLRSIKNDVVENK
jgi:hypothetical protein